jgi:hypothetical protein
MARSPAMPLDLQVRRARRRLFLQTLLDTLTVAWAIALAAAAGWFLLQPLVLAAAPPWLRWAVLGGAVGIGTLVALILAVCRRPSRVDAALALDNRFGLKERVTTALTLGPQQAASPAGVALLADVQTRIRPLRVPERFPLRLRRRAAMVPAMALLVALVALFYHPSTSSAPAAESQPLAVAPEQKADLERKLRQLEKKPRPPRPGEKRKSEELKRLEAELDKLAQKPPETRDQARDMVKDLTEVQDRVRKREKELAERAAAMKEQMRQLERLTGKKPADGPASRLQKALDEAAFKKAKEEAEKLGRQLEASEQANRLRKKIQQPELTEEDKREAREQLKRLESQELTPEQRKQLQKQVQDIEEKIERLTRSDAARERLRQLQRRGLLNQEQLDRELDQLAQNDAKLDPQTRELLRQVAQKLAEARKAMAEGKDAEAAQKLREAAELLNKLDGDGECKELAEQVAALEALRQALCQALEGKPKDAPGGPGGPASGRRPESKDGKTGAKEEWAHSDLDKGQLQVIDHVPGEGFKGPRQPAEMAEDIRRAAQEAPEAIDRQRLPKSASDMAKGYFEKLRGGK